MFLSGMCAVKVLFDILFTFIDKLSNAFNTMELSGVIVPEKYHESDIFDNEYLLICSLFGMIFSKSLLFVLQMSNKNAFVKAQMLQEVDMQLKLSRDFFSLIQLVSKKPRIVNSIIFLFI